MDLLKREKRRMDELITFKENQIDQLQNTLNQVNGKIRLYEEEILKFKNLEEKIRHQDKKYKREINNLQNELMIYKRPQCETQLSSHNSNVEPKYQISSVTTCTTNSNQCIEKPL